MNERIKELAVTAGVCEMQDDDGTFFDAIPQSCWEKFAELIVQECQSRVEQYISDCGEIASLPDSVLKQHFEVE